MFTQTHANKHWNKFGYDNYKLNIHLFEKYCCQDMEILNSSVEYNKLPKEKKGDVFNTPKKNAVKKRKRTRTTFELSSPEVTKECKIICVLSDSDSDTDDI